MNKLKEVAVIAWSELREAYKDKKMMIIVLMYVLLLALGMQQSVLLSKTFGAILYKVFFFTKNIIPFEILLFYFVSVVALPVFTLTISYDIISGSIDSMRMRYLATKVSRGSILLGKFLAVIIINASINLMLYLIAGLYIYFKTGNLLFIQTLELWLYLTVYLVYFASLGLLMSNITTKPHRSLFVGLFILTALFFPLSKSYLAWISPYNYYIGGFYLLAHKLSQVYLGIAVLFVTSLLFIIGSYLIFRRRDL